MVFNVTGEKEDVKKEGDEEKSNENDKTEKSETEPQASEENAENKVYNEANIQSAAAAALAGKQNTNKLIHLINYI